jgi:hypothetical protein
MDKQQRRKRKLQDRIPDAACAYWRRQCYFGTIRVVLKRLPSELIEMTMSFI